MYDNAVYYCTLFDGLYQKLLYLRSHLIVNNHCCLPLTFFNLTLNILGFALCIQIPLMAVYPWWQHEGRLTIVFKNSLVFFGRGFSWPNKPTFVVQVPGLFPPPATQSNSWLCYSLSSTDRGDCHAPIITTIATRWEQPFLPGVHPW